MNRTRVIAAGCASLLLVAGGLVVVDQAVAAKHPQHVVVSLGDSFISGESGNFKGNVYKGLTATSAWNNSNNNLGDAETYLTPFGEPGGPSAMCHRSPTAEINELAAATGDKAINLACSGAVTANILNTVQGVISPQEPQIQQLQAIADNPNYKIDAIVVSIGGNDIGFANALASCTEITKPVDCSTNGEMAKLQALGAATQTGITNSLNAISQEMNGDGYANGSYQLIDQSYPELMAKSGDRYPSSQPAAMSTSPGVPMSNASVDWAYNTAQPYIDQIVKNAVSNASDKDIKFLDLSDALQGHLLSQLSTQQVQYTGDPSVVPTAATAEWVTAVDPNYILDTLSKAPRLYESYHPNYFGQQAFGQALVETYDGSSQYVAAHGHANQLPTSETVSPLASI